MLREVLRQFLQTAPLILIRLEDDEVNRLDLTRHIEHKILWQRIADRNLAIPVNPRGIVGL